MGIKITIIGSGSTYTPELIEGLINKKDSIPLDELYLMDIDERKRTIVGGLVQRMIAHAEMKTKVVLTDNIDEALKGASFVLATTKMIKKRLYDITNEFCNDVIPDVRQRFLIRYKSYKGVEVDLALGITSIYLKYSIDNLGVITDLDIIAKVLKTSNSILSTLIRRYGLVKFDSSNNIFYDPVQRQKSLMCPRPSDYEIQDAKRFYNYRVLFMEDIIKKYIN